MKAYHNDENIKIKYVTRVKNHAQADCLIKGTGWSNGKGCAVGCTLERYDHAGYEVELGIPRAVARLEDVIFEGLPNELAMQWPTRFLESVPVGSDLSMVWPKFTLWVLETVIVYGSPKGKISIQGVMDLFKRWIDGEKPTIEEFRKCCADAAAAAYAYAYAYAAAAAAAAAAAYAYAYAYAYAKRKFWTLAADKLIEIIEESK